MPHHEVNHQMTGFIWKKGRSDPGVKTATVPNISRCFEDIRFCGRQTSSRCHQRSIVWKPIYVITDIIRALLTKPCPWLSNLPQVQIDGRRHGHVRSHAANLGCRLATERSITPAVHLYNQCSASAQPCLQSSPKISNAIHIIPPHPLQTSTSEWFGGKTMEWRGNQRTRRISAIERLQHYAFGRAAPQWLETACHSR